MKSTCPACGQPIHWYSEIHQMRRKKKLALSVPDLSALLPWLDLLQKWLPLIRSVLAGGRSSAALPPWLIILLKVLAGVAGQVG